MLSQSAVARYEDIVLCSYCIMKFTKPAIFLCSLLRTSRTGQEQRQHLLCQQSAFFTTAMETFMGCGLRASRIICFCVLLNEGVKIQARDSELCIKGENR